MLNIEARNGKRAAWRYYHEKLSRAEQNDVKLGARNMEMKFRVMGADRLYRVRDMAERIRDRFDSSSTDGRIMTAQQLGCWGPVRTQLSATHEFTGNVIFNYYQEISWCGDSSTGVYGYSCSSWGDGPGLGYRWNGNSADCRNGPAWGGEGWTQVGYRSVGDFSFCILGLGDISGGCLRSWLVEIVQWGNDDGGYGSSESITDN